MDPGRVCIDISAIARQEPGREAVHAILVVAGKEMLSAATCLEFALATAKNWSRHDWLDRYLNENEFAVVPTQAETRARPTTASLSRGTLRVITAG